MARRLRVEYPGALYHVTARGVNRQAIFFDNRDRLRFLELLGCTHEQHGFVLHGYCLMPNHYHLEVSTPEGNLSRGMHWLGHSYASFVNRRHGRGGHVFQGRFIAVVVEGEGYLQVLTRYIHLNPVRANLVPHAAQYPWSSYRAYLGATRCPAWLETESTLGQFGPTLPAARAAYRQFVEGEPPSDPFRELRSGCVLGSEAFLRRIEGLTGEAARRIDGPEPTPVARRPSLPEVLVRVCGLYRINEDQLTTKWRRGNEARDVAMYLCARAAGAPLAAIGDQFGGLRAAAVSMACRRVRERMESDDEFARRVSRIERSLRGQP